MADDFLGLSHVHVFEPVDDLAFRYILDSLQF